VKGWDQKKDKEDDTIEDYARRTLYEN